MRALALDLGDRRIGIAVSDCLKIIAGARETYIKKTDEEDCAYFSSIIEKEEVDTVVIGLPVNMDGTEGARAEKARRFGGLLSKYTAAKIVFQDERLTTVSAQSILIEANMRRAKRKGVVDQVAAAIILQEYLDTNAGV